MGQRGAIIVNKLPSKVLYVKYQTVSRKVIKPTLTLHAHISSSILFCPGPTTGDCTVLEGKEYSAFSFVNPAFT